ncbi:DNA-directed RNA polymerase [Sulfolobales archaeon HS-7]|nr:DNA-directed RNA polymerase [Sulfolobales archaeon HS-7]
MYKIIKAKGVVRIPPEFFGKPLEEVALNVLREEYQEKVIKDIGLILSVYDVNVNEEGLILMGDGATYHEAEFNLLVYTPVLQELVEGIVVQVTNTGLFVNIGPIDGFVHISQVMDDQMRYDNIRGMLVGEKSKKVIQKGDFVRARVNSIGAYTSGKMMRIGLTMRQPYLGKLEWLKEEVSQNKS